MTSISDIRTPASACLASALAPSDFQPAAAAARRFPVATHEAVGVASAAAPQCCVACGHTLTTWNAPFSCSKEKESILGI